MSNWIWFQDALGKGITNRTFSATSVAYSITGFPVGTALVASMGAYALTGNDATLAEGHKFLAGAGSFSLSGFGIGAFKRTHGMAADRGDYHVTPQTALLIKTRVPIKNSAPFVEGAWMQPENEGNLDAGVTVDVG